MIRTAAGRPREGDEQCACLICQGKARRFQASDWVGKMIQCPHCGKRLRVASAEGPYPGHDPAEGNREDAWWDLALSDGFHARMWEDRKVVLLDVQ